MEGVDDRGRRKRLIVRLMTVNGGYSPMQCTASCSRLGAEQYLDGKRLRALYCKSMQSMQSML